MTQKENVLAILRYEKYDSMPLCSFGWWGETLQKWENEGHIAKGSTHDYCTLGENCAAERAVMDKLGFDCSYGVSYSPVIDISPKFEAEILCEEADGSRIMRDEAGLIVRVVPGITSIPAEVGTTLVDRAAWEKYYLPKMQFYPERVNVEAIKAKRERADELGDPLAIYCGSMIGAFRNYTGVAQLSYLYADDPDLFGEIVHTFGELAYQCVKAALESGVKFDYGHFWEDICCKSGPLVTPRAFEKYVCPEYARITSLLADYGLDIVSLDCDGVIDRLVPGWVESGVNTMFPIEYGTWEADIRPWRERLGKKVRGVGGMNKKVFAQDKAAVEKEVERLAALIDLGGYIPCPDHRIAPDAKFELVAYYCELMRRRFH